MNVYELKAGGRPVLSVYIDTVSWLPVRPKPNIGWLRFLVAAALRNHFHRPNAVVTA